mgnify:CR=1 FL=1
MNRKEKIKDKILKNKSDLAQRYFIKKIGLFGSYLYGKQTRRSDADILVEFSKPVSLFDFLECEEFLSQLIGIKVDLVSRKALKPIIGKHILDEVEYI